MRGRIAGSKFSDKEWIHVSIWCKPSEWDRLNYLSIATGKTLSAWVIDNLMAHHGEVPYRPKIKNGERGCSKSLCVEKDKWEIVKQRAEEEEMNTSKYLLSILLKNDEC